MSPPSRSDADTRYRSGDLLQRAYRHARRMFSQSLSSTRLDPPHFGVLLHLSREEPLSQTQLARRNNSDRTAMVRTLDDLEALGYVVRTPSTLDRRANEITLTTTGRAAFAAARESAGLVTERIFGGLTAQERAQLDALLEKVIRHVESTEVPAP